MSDTVVEIDSLFNQDDIAKWVGQLWDKWNDARHPHRAEVQEMRNFLFATDTRSTSVDENTDWNNSTTYPKLCQIRDNLNSNYIAALFPNSDWLQWKAASREDAVLRKNKAIESYMKVKLNQRGSEFKTAIKRAILDYIDEGNVFMTAKFVEQVRMNAVGDEVVKYRGPVAVRIAPSDIVFNLRANSFASADKVVRSVCTLGELILRGEDEPEMKEAINQALAYRDEVRKQTASFDRSDWDKHRAFAIDGFGDLKEYFMSNTVEILEFYGNYYDSDTNQLYTNQRIVVMDRMHVLAKGNLPGWMGSVPIYHVGWRQRDYNLWGMSPLANLVGMQYRIDHLANLRADAMDLAVDPPLGVRGDVEEFIFAPGERVEMGESGDVVELGKNLNGVIVADQEISQLEARMEMMAGAPREAMGIRSPGEKTAFEVSKLDNAATRVFKEKITQFEEEVLEPLLDYMLELSVRYMSGNETEDLVVNESNRTEFRSITKDDLMASGQYKAVGSKHFGDQALLVQNINNLANSRIFDIVAPHISGVQMSKMMETALNIEDFGVFKENAAIEEQMETQSVANAAQETLAARDATEGDLEV